MRIIRFVFSRNGTLPQTNFQPAGGTAEDFHDDPVFPFLHREVEHMIRRLIGVNLVSGLQRIINFFAVHRKFEPVVRSTADLHHAVRRSFKFIEQIHWSLLGELVAKFREVNRVVFHLHRFRFRPVRGPGNFPFRIQGPIQNFAPCGSDPAISIGERRAPS